VQRVQRWRQANPGYRRRSGAKVETALQDESSVQPIDLHNNSGTFAKDALQDLMLSQPFVLIGLLANLTYERKQPLDSCRIVSFCFGFHQFLW
jgi:hypothetical protein